MQNNIDWDKATAGPVEKDHLPDCEKSMNENDSDECICAAIEKDLGAFYEDRSYQEYKDSIGGPIR